MITPLTASHYFDVIKFAASVREVNENGESGRAKVGIVFPPDYARDIQGGRQTSVQVIVDATDNLSASSALSAAQTIGMLKSQGDTRGEILAPRHPRAGAGDRHAHRPLVQPRLRNLVVHRAGHHGAAE